MSMRCLLWLRVVLRHDFLYVTPELHLFVLFFFLNDTAPPDIYPLPLPAALPIFAWRALCFSRPAAQFPGAPPRRAQGFHRLRARRDREIGAAGVARSPVPFSVACRTPSSQEIGRAHV